MYPVAWLPVQLNCLLGAQAHPCPCSRFQRAAMLMGGDSAVWRHCERSFGAGLIPLRGGAAKIADGTIGVATTGTLRTGCGPAAAG